MDIQGLLCRSVDYIGRIFFGLIIARTIMSWLNVWRDNQVIQLVYYITELILAPIRRLLQRSNLVGQGMVLDFSPIIACFLIQIATWLIISVILIF